MRSRRPHPWHATLGFFVLGSSAVPAPVAATTPTPVCAALVASTPDIPALEQSLTRDPSAVSDICTVEKITPDFTVVDAIVGIVVFPYLIHRLNTAGKPYTKKHGALELAVMRQSQPAATVLLAAGADPVAQTDQTRSALEWGVTLDLETDTTEWTTLLLERWSAEIPPNTLSTHTLDRLFHAPILATQLHAAGLPPHGVDARGTTWLHRSLYRDEMPFFTRVDLGVPMGKEQQEARAAVSFDAVLARGIPVDQADREGFTALYYAVEAQNWAAFQALLDAGARPEQAGSEPYTVLAALARAGDLERFQQMMGRLERAGALSSEDAMITICRKA